MSNIELDLSQRQQQANRTISAQHKIDPPEDGEKIICGDCGMDITGDQECYCTVSQRLKNLQIDFSRQNRQIKAWKESIGKRIKENEAENTSISKTMVQMYKLTLEAFEAFVEGK